MVEHSGFEPLNSTMRMSRATSCADAQWWFSYQYEEGSSSFQEQEVGERCNDFTCSYLILTTTYPEHIIHIDGVTGSSPVATTTSP